MVECTSREQYSQLYGLLDDVNMPMADVSLCWVIANSDISTGRIGARSVEEVGLNVRAVEAKPLHHPAT